MPAGEGRSVWTTAVDLMLMDIMIFGVDQDIVVGCQSFSRNMHSFAYHSIKLSEVKPMNNEKNCS